MGVGLAAVLLLTAVLYTRTDDWAALWQRPPQETAVGDLSTLDFRREVWLWGVTAVGEFPLTGTGLGTFRRVAPERYPIAVPDDFDIAHAHNIFLQVALDTGLPGLAAYASLLIITGLMGWRAAADKGDYRPLVLGLLAALMALHVYGLGDALAPGSKPAVIFWLILGLIVMVGQQPKNSVK
jgi:putative inorganic carbon (HCO3(-)) transporter